MIRRRLALALVASGLLHVVLGVMAWRAWRDAVAERAPPVPIAVDEGALDVDHSVAPAPPAAMAVAVLDAPPTAAESLLAAAAAAGDADRRELHPRAPTAAPNPDPHAGAAAASSDVGPGVPALDLTGRRDRETMHVQLYDADQGYQLERIRTGPARLSREDVRATPHPGLAPELASRAGDGRARRAPGGAALGALDGGRGSLARPGLPAGDSSDDERAAQSLAEESRGAARIGKDGEEAAGFRRPLIERGPASTDAARRSEEVADASDSAAVSSELTPGRIELSHPGPLARDGHGGGRGTGRLPAWARAGRGLAAVPGGDPSAPTGDDLALATFRRRYNQYLSDVRRKVDPLWEFPRDLAIKLEQGEVRVAYTIRRDGTVKDVRVLKSSGFSSFDKNVIAAIRRAAPFRPLPPVFGSELQLTSAFDGQNPVVR